MPTPYIQKLSKEGKGSVSSLESKWAQAKAKAKKEGKGDNYAYITSIFQKMVHASVVDLEDRVFNDYVDQVLASYVEDRPIGEKLMATGGFILSVEGPHKGQILWQRRGQTGDYAGTWGCFGGKIEPGETEKDALQRELEEETGLHDTLGVIPLFRYVDDELEFQNYLVLIKEPLNGFEPKIDRETMEFKWCALPLIPTNLHPKCGLCLLDPVSKNCLKFATQYVLDNDVQTLGVADLARLIAKECTGVGAPAVWNNNWELLSPSMSPEQEMDLLGLHVLLEEPRQPTAEDLKAPKEVVARAIPEGKEQKFLHGLGNLLFRQKKMKSFIQDVGGSQRLIFNTPVENLLSVLGGIGYQEQVFKSLILLNGASTVLVLKGRKAPIAVQADGGGTQSSIVLLGLSLPDYDRVLSEIPWLSRSQNTMNWGSGKTWVTSILQPKKTIADLPLKNWGFKKAKVLGTSVVRTYFESPTNQLVLVYEERRGQNAQIRLVDAKTWHDAVLF